MKLEQLLKDVDVIDTSVPKGIQVQGLQYDSRQVKVGDLFIAIQGFKTDGHQYIKKALENKALGVVIDNPLYCSEDYPWILVSDSRQALADLARNFYHDPSKNFLLIGVTGTNGKTTTTNLIAKIFEDLGYRVGLIGTIQNRIGTRELPVERTTPESLDLQQLFAQMVAEGVSCVVMEVSSHALDLHRVRGSDFDIGVFTNLTQDHLDYHQSMEEYYCAKAKLFTHYLKEDHKFAVINIDDPWGQKLIKEVETRVITYGLGDGAVVKGTALTVTPQGVSYTLGELPVNLKLTGKFNVYNSLAALAVANGKNIRLPEAIKSLEKVQGVPGRFQPVEGSQDITIIVDYAHTSDSLINVLTTAREFAQGRLITVFGCGGDRDRTKRPLMGEAAAQYSDFCIITSDNPRSEEPEAIVADIIPGVERKTDKNGYKIIVDRKDAIKEAIQLAQKDDIIILAGKGHENYQEIKGKKYPFDDKLIAEELLREIHG